MTETPGAEAKSEVGKISLSFPSLSHFSALTTISFSLKDTKEGESEGEGEGEGEQFKPL